MSHMSFIELWDQNEFFPPFTWHGRHNHVSAFLTGQLASTSAQYLHFF